MSGFFQIWHAVPLLCCMCVNNKVTYPSSLSYNKISGKDLMWEIETRPSYVPLEVVIMTQCEVDYGNNLQNYWSGQ